MSSNASLGLLALGGIASLAVLSQRFRGQTSSSSSSEREQELQREGTTGGVPGQVVAPLVLTQELSIWPQLAAALSEATSPGVFRTLDSCALVLRLARSLCAELQAPSLDAYYAQLGVIERTRMKNFAGTKMVVIEGLSGAGKSTLIHGLTSPSSTYPVGTVEHSPVLLGAQSVFASMPESILKAFEFSTNYFTAYDIASSDHKVALVERYYHAICAHTVCDVMLNGEDLAQFHPSVFDWPVDLPVPDLVIYLVISTESRLKRRRLGGGTSATDRSADRMLARDKRIESCMASITGPHTIAIDASGAPGEILSAAREACEEYSIPIPNEDASSRSPKRISLGVYGAWS